MKVLLQWKGSQEVLIDLKIYDEANLQFSQPIFLGGQVWTAVNIAENSRDAQKMSYLASRRLSVQRILNLTLEYLAEVERLKVIRDSEKVQEEFDKVAFQVFDHVLKQPRIEDLFR